MGGYSQTTPTAEPTSSVLSSYTQYLPGLLAATSAQQPNVAENQLNATLATQPIYNALNLQQAQNYAVPLAQVGQDVTRSNALAGARTNLDQILGAGGESALAAQGLSRLTNPNYYQAIDPTTRQTANMLNSVNLNGLSPGEYNSVERSLNQSNTATGNLGLDNATNAVSNAMNYGGAFNQKLSLLNSMLPNAANVANAAQNTGFSPVNIALGQPNQSTMSNFGTGTFSNTSAGTQNQSGNNAFNFGSSLLNNMTSMNTANTSAAAQQNSANIGANAQVAAAGVGNMGACCFIFLESYNGTLPEHIRKCRNRYYIKFPEIAIGYKRMAKWLVPLMKKYKLVRFVVWRFMVEPLTQYGGFVRRLWMYKDGRQFKYYRKFWFSVWYQLGKDKN